MISNGLCISATTPALWFGFGLLVLQIDFWLAYIGTLLDSRWLSLQVDHTSIDFLQNLLGILFKSLELRFAVPPTLGMPSWPISPGNTGRVP